jgi:PAS domain-containing protein
VTERGDFGPQQVTSDWRPLGLLALPHRLESSEPKPQRHRHMTSQGSAHARFQRAIKRGHLLAAETAARELGALSNSDVLALVLLYHRFGDRWFELAARRWIRRVQIDHSLRHEEVELLRASMGALRTRFRSIALDALLETCRELRLPPPTITS